MANGFMYISPRRLKVIIEELKKEDKLINVAVGEFKTSLNSTVEALVEDLSLNVDLSTYPTKEELTAQIKGVSDHLSGVVSDINSTISGIVSGGAGSGTGGVQHLPTTTDAKLVDLGGLKVWSAEVVSSDGKGFFTVDYSEAGFTEPPTVMVTAYSENPDTDDTEDNANYACIMSGSVTNTGCRGRAKNANSAGALVAMVGVNAVCTIKVLAIGA